MRLITQNKKKNNNHSKKGFRLGAFFVGRIGLSNAIETFFFYILLDMLSFLFNFAPNSEITYK